MNPMWKSIIGSVVRWFLQGAAAWIVAQGVITKEQSEWIIAAIIAGAAALIWSFYQKYGARLKLVTALELPANASEKKVEAVIAETPAGDNVSKAFQAT